MLDQIFTARLFLVASLLACAACSSGKASSDAASAGYTKIDDMEGTTGFIEWTSPPGMTPGFWWSATNCTEGYRISPVLYLEDPYGWSYAALPAPYETFPGTVSTHAARLRTTSPLVGIWGANMGFDFAELPPFDGGPIWPPPMGSDAGTPADGQPCRQGTTRDFNGGTVDLSAYSGITFWAMATMTGVKTVRVQLNDRNTDPRGGICNPADPSNESNCYNGFRVEVAMTDSLTQYTIDFSSLLQDPSWGYRPDPDALDLQHVYQMNFEVDLPSCTVDPNAKCAGGAPSVTFDFWIDDLYFVNK
jgi:hypothetical protein